MKLRFVTVALTASVLAGCVTPPQRAVPLSTLDAHAGKVGVAMTALPTVDTYMPGAGCLLCLAAASVANSKLTAYSHTLPPEGMPELKNTIAELLRKKGVDAVVINDNLDLKALPKPKAKGPDVASRDFSALRAKYGVDHLVVIEFNELGFERPYASYVPTSDPKGVVAGVGYEVNLSSNTYEWYMPLDVQVSAEGKWDEPPKFPGLTNAYFQALEMSKDNLTKPFSG